jgi:hypothetical protein
MESARGARVSRRGRLVAVQPHAGFAFRHPRPVRPSDPPLLGVVVGLIEAVK